MTSGLPEFEGDGPNREQSSRVQACIVMAATQDLVAASKDKTDAGAVAFFGGTCAECRTLYAKASPITHVRAGVPPTIFIEGEKDTLKVGRAEMQEKLRALGIETSLHTLKDAPHPFWMSQPWLDQTVQAGRRSSSKRHLGETRLNMPIGKGKRLACNHVLFFPGAGREKEMVGGRFMGSNISAAKGFQTIFESRSADARNVDRSEFSERQCYRWLRYKAP